MEIMCEGCVHVNVCMKDKRLIGDVFVPGNPMFFDNNELYRRYEERKAAGFPCEDFLSVKNVVKEGHWYGESDGYADGHEVYDIWSCSNCGTYFDEWDEEPAWKYCPHCGARMTPCDSDLEEE